MAGTASGDTPLSIETDPTTPVGMVRLLVTDMNPEDPLFTDAQIEAFLTAENGSRKLAAATILDCIARNEALISKKITTQDLSTDGPAVAKELRASAQALRDQAAAGQDVDDGPPIEIAALWRFDRPPPWANTYL